MGDLDFEELDRMIDDISNASSDGNTAAKDASSGNPKAIKSTKTDLASSKPSSDVIERPAGARTHQRRRSMDVLPAKDAEGDVKERPSMAELHAQVMARREKRAEEIRRRMAEERRARAAAHEGQKEQRRKVEPGVEHKTTSDKDVVSENAEDAARKAREAAELAEQLEADRVERAKLEREPRKAVARRMVQYAHTSSRRALTQPRPVEETALDLSVPESTDEEPYTSPFIDGVQVSKKPIGENMQSNQVEMPKAPLDSGIHTGATNAEQNSTDAAANVESAVSKNDNEKAREDDFIDDFIGEMKERREAKARLAERPTAAPDMSAKLDRVNNSRVEDPNWSDNEAADRAARESESRYAMANIPTYDEYITGRKHHGWGWVLLFVILLAAVSFAGVYLYLNNFFA